MAVEYWSPLRDAVSLRDAMNALFQDSFVRPGTGVAQNAFTALPLDVCETEHGFVIKAGAAGREPGRRGNNRSWRHLDDSRREQGRGRKERRAVASS